MDSSRKEFTFTLADLHVLSMSLTKLFSLLQTYGSSAAQLLRLKNRNESPVQVQYRMLGDINSTIFNLNLILTVFSFPIPKELAIGWKGVFQFAVSV